MGVVAVVAAVTGPGSAAAEVESSRILPLEGGHAIEVIQSDISTQFVPPLDSSPVSAEFFYDAVYTIRITGPEAAAFTGTSVVAGFQVGYPVALPGGGITLYTPGLEWGVESGGGVDLGLAEGFSLGLNAEAIGPIGGEPEDTEVAVGGDVGIAPEVSLNVGAESLGILGGDIIPSQEAEILLEPGGITDVPILEGVAFDGPETTIHIAGVHASISGVVGPVNVRPYLKAITSNGDTVVTYGPPHTM
ncbi:MspA family porin [Rhodococcus sp. Z13]|uniref:MspA family porin n=1 Tax=Rhodococcus sacchari TaxID=2962047 RepID=A0ACD4DCV3_9NOCA|nr:MspA family porin [Rhodococcus sp. Z13]UYP17888.1 MspA family porin [Rhodococcus sp. Z13]